MTDNKLKKNKPITLTEREQLAMFRCAFYTAMGARNGEPLPTDHQCLQWLNRLMAQAEHITDPPITLMARPPVSVKNVGSIPGVIVQWWDALIDLPDWRDLPQ